MKAAWVRGLNTMAVKQQGFLLSGASIEAVKMMASSFMIATSKMLLEAVFLCNPAKYMAGMIYGDITAGEDIETVTCIILLMTIQLVLERKAVVMVSRGALFHILLLRTVLRNPEQAQGSAPILLECNE